MMYLYPQGKKRALTFSYDDGQKYDRKLVEIFNRYGMKATFHLNSGTLSASGDPSDMFVGRNELRELYAGHEVACHGVWHKNLAYQSAQGILRELAEDRKALEQLTGGFVQGLSYAFGCYSAEVENIARTVGIKYSRTVEDTKQFHVPMNFLEWHPTCHHEDPNLMELGKQLMNTQDWQEIPLMYVWGHSFEFGNKGNWDLMEAFCEQMAGNDSIWYATNMEICDYINAIRSLVFSMDGSRVYNPTLQTVWMTQDGKILECRSGETLDLTK